MDERGGLERMAGRFMRHLKRSHAAQFIINKR
jgi:hypothetical protein